METFLVYCIPCAIFGLFFATVLSAHADTKKGRVICFILTFLISTCLMAEMFTLEAMGDEKTWNNGYCDCGGEWEFGNASRYKMGTTYYWKCDTCGQVIQTQHNMK